MLALNAVIPGSGVEYLEFDILHPVWAPWFHRNVALNTLKQLDINTNSTELIEYGNIVNPIYPKFRFYTGSRPLEVYAVRSFSDYGTQKRWRGVFDTQAGVITTGSDPVSGWMAAGGFVYLLGFEWDRNPAHNQNVAVY
jgi:hypothetical protein